MAISIDWATKIIHVSKADMVLAQSVPFEVYTLDIDDFRLALKDLEDDDEGMVFDTTHSHNTEVQLGSVKLSRVVQLINGYTVTFEDGQYAVDLIGANSNIGDKVNLNQVSVRSYNSGGLITVTSGSGVTPQDVLDIATAVWQQPTTNNNAGTFGELLAKRVLTLARYIGLK
jgi:hypothetical protein